MERNEAEVRVNHPWSRPLDCLSSVSILLPPPFHSSHIFLTEVEIKSGDKFDKNISLNKRLSYKGKKDWLISYWNYRKTLFSLKEEATKRRFLVIIDAHKGSRYRIDIPGYDFSDKTYLIRSIQEKKRSEGGGKKCNKADSLESLHTALTENTCS